MSVASIIIFIARKIIRPLEQEWIKADDHVRSISVENLAQIQMIRSCFASNEINSRLKKADQIMIEKEGNLWFTHILSYTFTKILYIITVFIVSNYILHSIINGQMAIAVGIGLVFTYIQGTKEVLKLDRPIREITKSLTRIKDLYFFIHNFGKQTYPVLEESECPIEKPTCSLVENTINIEAKNLFFDYHARAKLFDNHTLILNTSCSLPIKLYGIIGPSGIGKSTLISILGGQLKPTSGTVTIDNINIYETNDNIRRCLIALQGQVATSMRGSLRYNLLFGLPEKIDYYSDEHLVNILKRVGLWTLFESKEGLHTFIGEGGLNLSGGQRQRLNFANLYLRANYFNPAIILIDEPTSSLDEVSEQAITDMIVELSEKAVTLVIAHRLKTVERAIGILDCSLLLYEKEMIFYSHEKLLEHSNYYNMLLFGKISLED